MPWYSFALILFLAAVFFSLQHNLLQITRQCSGVIRHTQISIRVRFYGYRALVLTLGSFHVPSGTSWGHAEHPLGRQPCVAQCLHPSFSPLY